MEEETEIVEGSADQPEVETEVESGPSELEQRIEKALAGEDLEAEAPAKPSEPKADFKPSPEPEAEKATEKEPARKGVTADVPARLNAEAKAAWDKAPDPVKFEVNRALQEMEQGLEKQRETITPIKPYLDMVQGDPQKLAGALERFTNLEKILTQNPLQGLIEIGRNMQLSREQMAQMLTGQAVGQPDARDQEITALKQQVEQLSGGFQQVQTTLEGQRQSEVARGVESFAAENPRFDELAEDIARALETGFAKTLQEAYDMAARLKPAPTAPEAHTQQAQSAGTAQTRKAKSIVGGPDGGERRRNTHDETTKQTALRHLSAMGLQ